MLRSYNEGVSKRSAKQKKRRQEKRQARKESACTSQPLKQRFLMRLREERARRRQLTARVLFQLEKTWDS